MRDRPNFEFPKFLEDTLSGIVDLIERYFRTSWILLRFPYRIVNSVNKNKLDSYVGPFSYLIISLLLFTLLYSLSPTSLVDSSPAKDENIASVKNINSIAIIATTLPFVITISLWGILLSRLYDDSSKRKYSLITLLCYTSGYQGFLATCTLVLINLSLNVPIFRSNIDTLWFWIPITFLFVYLLLLPALLLYKYSMYRIPQKVTNRKFLYMAGSIVFSILIIFSSLFVSISIPPWLYAISEKAKKERTEIKIIKSDFRINTRNQVFLTIVVTNELKEPQVFSLANGVIQLDVEQLGFEQLGTQGSTLSLRRSNFDIISSGSATQPFIILNQNDAKWFILSAEFNSKIMQNLSRNIGSNITGMIMYSDPYDLRNVIYIDWTAIIEKQNTDNKK